MIPLHVNWSVSLRQLLVAEKIVVDGIKLPDWVQCLLPAMDLARSVNTRAEDAGGIHKVGLHVHFAHGTSEGVLSDHQLVQCEGFLEATDTAVVNTHFRVPLDLVVAGKLNESRLMSTAFAHVEQLVGKFGRDAVVIEHTPEPQSLADIGCYPVLLTHLVHTTGAGLVLDISHARLSARLYGCSTAQYIERLPLDRLRMIHTTGVGQDVNGSWVDHLPMDGEDYGMLQFLLEGGNAGRHPIASAVQHEYGRIGGFLRRYSSAEVLEREVNLLRALLSETRHPPGFWGPKEQRIHTC